MPMTDKHVWTTPELTKLDLFSELTAANSGMGSDAGGDYAYSATS